jgi:1,4-dihydroxy-2-naphthoate octaprenyltransferase
VAIGEGRELNLILGETSRNMLLFGILLAIGLCL